jgi:transposase
MVSVPRTQPPYPEEFRREAVELVRREGRSVPDVATRLGVSAQSLCAWLKQTELDQGERSDGLSTDQRDELRRLKAENRRVRQQREILKRSAAFFARETETR